MSVKEKEVDSKDVGGGVRRMSCERVNGGDDSRHLGVALTQLLLSVNVWVIS